MDAINFTIGILGLIVSSFAVYYARNSWLKPVPALIFNEKSFSSRKISDSHYLNTIDISISNDSQVTALFQDMLINGSSCKTLKEKPLNWTESGVQKKTLVNHFNLNRLKPGLTIKTGGNQIIEYLA